MATAEHLFGRYGDLVLRFDHCGGSFEEESVQHLLLTTAHGQLDEAAAASAVLRRLRRVSPLFDTGVYAGNLTEPAHRRVLLDGLDKAGLK